MTVIPLRLIHYTRTELPWWSKTAKEYAYTAKEMILGGWPPRIEGQGNSIYLADNFLGGLAAKQNRWTAKSSSRQGKPTPAKKIISLAATNRQVNYIPWRPYTTKYIAFLGDHFPPRMYLSLAAASGKVIYFPWRTPTAKVIYFS